MSEMHHLPGILRPIGPVLAGVSAVIILSTATDLALQACGVFPPLGEPMGEALLLLATAHRSAYAIVGSYIAAMNAPDRPMRNALAVGTVGFALSIAGAVMTWGVGPAWYELALVAIAMPGAWVGGRLHGVRGARHTA